jgi:Ran-binding protein 3
VFGENLSDRVVNSEPGDVNGSEEQKDKIPDVTSPEKDVVPSTDAPPLPSATTPTKENMFFSTAATATPGKEIVPQNQDESSSKKSLSEAAAEYTESHSNKRKYDEVAVVTGEEEESNVLKMNVKLYLFDSDSRNWTERGRGMLRLNDAPASTPGHLKSRLVMRTSGSLRVVLNTKLWPEMICQRPNEKSLRISAMDGDIARVFLISASPKDTDKLFTALEYRLSQLKTDKAESEEPPEKKAALDD